MNIRFATPADLPQLVTISNSAGSAAHWNQQQWLDIFHSPIAARLAWIAEQPERRRLPRTGLQSSTADGCPTLAAAVAAKVGEPDAPVLQNSAPLAVGFLIAQCGAPEWELENVAVLPAFRRRGAGAALLSTLLQQARARRAERVLLEVRASNQSAIRLYGQAGFQLLTRRRGYYQNPAEDALLFGYPL
jgi:ribosomal-protein-alanine acetyltransferase